MIITQNFVIGYEPLQPLNHQRHILMTYTNRYPQLMTVDYSIPMTIERARDIFKKARLLLPQINRIGMVFTQHETFEEPGTQNDKNFNLKWAIEKNTQWVYRNEDDLLIRYEKGLAEYFNLSGDENYWDEDYYELPFHHFPNLAIIKE